MNLEISLTSFTKIFIETLNKYAPIKNKYVRPNHANFVTKELRKSIMLRSRLRNIFLKEKSLEAKKAHSKQRNICISVVKKAKNLQFHNINSSGIADGKKFWTIVNSLFGNKVKTNYRIILI